MSGVPEDKLPDLAFASMEVKSTLDVALPDVLIEDDQLDCAARVGFPGRLDAGPLPRPHLPLLRPPQAPPLG